MKTSFLTVVSVLSAIVASNSAFATNENTVTSKSYVDAQDALKQNKLHTASATPANNGTTVVTYTDTEGTPGERGIFDYDTSGAYDENDNSWWQAYNLSDGHEGDLVTAETYIVGINYIGETLSNMEGEDETVVVRGRNGMPSSSRNIYDGSTTYSAATDSDSLITAGAVQGRFDNFENNLTPVRVVKTVCSNPPACTLWEMQNTFVHELGSNWECATVSDCPACAGTLSCSNHTCSCIIK